MLTSEAEVVCASDAEIDTDEVVDAPKHVVIEIGSGEVVAVQVSEVTFV